MGYKCFNMVRVSSIARNPEIRYAKFMPRIRAQDYVTIARELFQSLEFPYQGTHLIASQLKIQPKHFRLDVSLFFDVRSSARSHERFCSNSERQRFLEQQVRLCKFMIPTVHFYR